jgi:hypothetical protein
MSDISQLASRVGGKEGYGKISPYYYTTWLRERGREGGSVLSPGFCMDKHMCSFVHTKPYMFIFD